MFAFLKKVINRAQRGQALAEISLILPIFALLIAGTVEVSNLLITKNRIETAADAAARFGAQGGNNEVLDSVVLNTVTQTLDLASGRWDIWAVRATIIDADNIDWEVEHIYGDMVTTFYTDTVAIIEDSCVRSPTTLDKADPDANVCIRDQVLARFNRDAVSGTFNGTDLDGLQFVGVYIIHDLTSILGLSTFPALADIYGVAGLGLVRFQPGIGSAQVTEGCATFPIAIHEGARSLTDVDGGNPYPDEDDFDYPFDPPTYESFFRNVPQVPLRQAQEGYIYKAQNGFGNGNFGWLLWNDGRAASAQVLADSLAWPGDSTNYADNGDNQIYPATPLYPHIVRGYVEPIDSLDIAMHVGDWVSASTGAVNAFAVRAELADHVSNELRTLRLVVWNDSNDQGANGRYRISGFVIGRLRGFKLDQSQGGSWILFEFVRWDDSCGQIEG